MSTPASAANCGDQFVVRLDGYATVAATCANHGLEHHDPVLGLSWPTGMACVGVPAARDTEPEESA